MNTSIKTARLLLREFVPTDWPAVHAYAADPDVVRFMNWGPNSESDTRAFVAKAIAQSQQRPRRAYHLAIVVQETGDLVGGVALKMLGADPRSGELGYTLNPLAWGNGYASELARAMVEFGFQNLGLRRIWATCRPENQASYRILRKAGLTFEEYLQNERQVRGQWVYAFLCGLNRDTWLEARATEAKPNAAHEGPQH